MIVAKSVWHFQPEIDCPFADALDLAVLVAAPQEHAVPPGIFRSFTSRSRLQRFVGVGRLSRRLQIRDRRECPQGFDPAAAG